MAARNEPTPTFGASGEMVEVDGVYTGRGPAKPRCRWRALPALVWLCEGCAAALDASYDGANTERAG